MKHRSIIAATIVALSGPVSAQSPSTAAVPPPILSGLIQPGITQNGLLASTGLTFRNFDADRDGQLSQTDVNLHGSVHAASQRMNTVMAIMQCDLDGDGSVTEAEVRARRRYDQRQNHERTGSAAGSHAAQLVAEIARLNEADADKDGRVTWLEASAYADRTRDAAQGPQYPAVQLRELLAFAGTPERPLRLEAFEALAVRLFHQIDLDGNGTISQEESLDVQRKVSDQQRLAMEAERLREARIGCTLPKASSAAKVVLVSAYEGDALSTTTIASQDVVTRAASILVEPGDEPIYVVVASFSPTIWRFSGAVERIERVALAARATGPNSSHPKGRPLVGATGVPAEKVVFLPRSTCLDYFDETPSTKASGAIANVRNETGKEPIVAARYAVSSVAIPSANIQTASQSERPGLVIRKNAGSVRIEGEANVIIETSPAELRNEVGRFFPGGVIEIDPATVVAGEKAARYEVLPSQAGLLQLVQTGALVRNRSGEFLIRQKIRFPAGLYGAHSARFLLLRGVPAPDGDPGHSCVISEETGKPLLGGRASC